MQAKGLSLILKNPWINSSLWSWSGHVNFIIRWYNLAWENVWLYRHSQDAIPCLTEYLNWSCPHPVSRTWCRLHIQWYHTHYKDESLASSFQVSEVFRVHWFWKRFTPPNAVGNTTEKELQSILAKRSKIEKKASLDRGSSPDESSGVQLAGGLSSRQNIFDSSRSMMHLGDTSSIILEGLEEDEGHLDKMPNSAQASMQGERSQSTDRLALESNAVENSEPFQQNQEPDFCSTALESRQLSQGNAEVPCMQPSPFSNVRNSSQRGRFCPIRKMP